MKTNRRGFLMGTPLAAFALAQFDEEAFSQTSNAGAPPDVVDFWVRDMGVPAHMVLGGETTRGRRPAAGPETSNLAREPLFLLYDPDEGALIPADQIPSAKMHPFTDAKMDFQLVRMRLNPSDHQQFENYTSGGIYLDFQQGQPQSIFGEMVSLATTSFSAIFPGAKTAAKSGSKSAGKSGSSSTSSAASKSPAAAPAAAAAARQPPPYRCRRPSSRSRSRCRADWGRPPSPVSPRTRAKRCLVPLWMSCRKWSIRRWFPTCR